MQIFKRRHIKAGTNSDASPAEGKGGKVEMTNVRGRKEKGGWKNPNMASWDACGAARAAAWGRKAAERV